MKISHRAFGRTVRRVVVPAAFAALVVGPAFAQSPPPAPAQPPAHRALTADEQAALAQMLNRINTLSGPQLQLEVRRLAGDYADRELNLPAIAVAVRVAAGNKLGAVNLAFAAACADARTDSPRSALLCAAAAAQPENNGPGALPGDVAGMPPTPDSGATGAAPAGASTTVGGASTTAGDLEGVQTTALGGAGGGASTSEAAGSGTLGGGGNPIGTGNSGTLTSSSTGMQDYSAFSSSVTRSRTVGSSVSAR